MVELKEVKIGSKVTVIATVEDISDWGYPIEARMAGHDGDIICLKPSQIASVEPPACKAGDRFTTAHDGLRGLCGEVLKVRGNEAIVLFDDGTVHVRWPVKELHPVTAAR